MKWDRYAKDVVLTLIPLVNIIIFGFLFFDLFGRFSKTAWDFLFTDIVYWLKDWINKGY